MSTNCSLCPRECHADRHHNVGFCGAGNDILAAKAYLHRWEEPCLSGNEPNRGSGTIFFSGCQLKCPFCQNYEISHNCKGKALSVRELAKIMLNLQKNGAHNINLVSPTPYIPQIVSALDECGSELNIPVAFNSGGYEKPQTIHLLKGYVNIYMPDFKFLSAELSKQYLKAENYAKFALKAIGEMINQVGKPVINESGIMQSGVIVRHLVMPGCYRDSIAILKLLKEQFGTDNFLISLMSQYTPCYHACDYPKINRRITTFEYDKVSDYAAELGFNGYFQQRDSADDKFIPDWDFSGL